MYVITLPECFRYLKVDATEFFFKQMGQQQIASELNIEASKLLLWQVYTDDDFKARQKQKYCIRPPSKNNGMINY